MGVGPGAELPAGMGIWVGGVGGCLSDHAAGHSIIATRTPPVVAPDGTGSWSSDLAAGRSVIASHTPCAGGAGLEGRCASALRTVVSIV